MLGLDTIADVYKKVNWLSAQNEHIGEEYDKMREIAMKEQRAADLAVEKLKAVEAAKRTVENELRKEKEAHRKDVEEATRKTRDEWKQDLKKQEEKIKADFDLMLNQKLALKDGVIANLEKKDSDYLYMKKGEVEKSKLLQSLTKLEQGCQSFQGRVHIPGKPMNVARISTVQTLVGKMSHTQNELTKIMLQITHGLEVDERMNSLAYVVDGVVQGRRKPWWTPLADMWQSLTHMCVEDSAVHD